MIKYSVKKPYTIFVGIMLVLVLGVVSFLGLNTDLLPSMDLPFVIIQTTYPGASPERVETSVTRPLEQAVATVSGLENVTSISSENVSLVIMEFNEGINMDSVMIDLSANIDMVSGYFEDTVQPPILMKINPDSLPIQLFTVNYDGMDIKDLTAYTNDELLPFLERVEGVATVTADGLVEDRIEIRLLEDRVNEINDKILRSVDSDLYDAKRELTDARDDIEIGLIELDNSLDDAADELGALSAQLDSGLAELKALASTKTSLETRKGMKTGQVELTRAKLGVVSALEGFEVIPEPMESLTINEIMLLLPDPTLVAAMQEMIDSGMVKGEQTLLEVRNALVASITEINAQLSAVVAPQAVINADNSTALGEQLSLLETELTGINQEIAEASIVEQQLSSAITELENNYAMMEANKLTLTTELAVTESALNSALTDIEAGLTEFETAQEEALASANIDSLVTVDAISGILTAQNFSFPAGYALSGDEQLTVKVGDEFADLNELKNLLLLDMGLEGVDPIHLKDVAEIMITDNSEDSYVRLNGQPAITISVQKSSVSSTSEVSGNMNETIANLMEQDENLHIDMLMDQGIYIDIVIDSVMNNLIYGGIIALFVLLFFLKDIRPTAVIGLSIPISLLFSIVLMYFSDVTLNIISLSGLALGVGMLVDNSIVVIENIYRLRNEGYSRIKSAVVGASQVSGAIFASTLTTVCVFLPIVFTDGISRQLFTDMGLTIAYSLFASLIVALTVVPAMSSNLLRADKQTEHRLFDKFVGMYEKLLRFNLRHKWIVIISTMALFGFTVYNLFQMPMELFPAMDSTQLTMTYSPDDSNRDETIENAEIISDAVLTIDGVQSVSMVYSAALGFGSSSSVSYNIVLSEESGLVGSDVTPQIRELTSEYEEFLSVSTSNMDMTALSGEGISIEIKGNDLDMLQEIATDVAEKVSTVSGIAEVVDGSEDRQQELRITVDRTKATEYNLMTAQVYQLVADALSEETQSAIFNFDNNDMTAFIIPTEIANADTLKDIVVATTTVEDETEEDEDAEEDNSTTERDVLLSEVATINEAFSPTTINRDNQSRIQTVSLSILEDNNVSLVSRDVEEIFADYALPEGYSLEFTGENETIVSTMNDLYLMILLAIIFIYLIMVSQFQNLLSPFIVLFTIPLAFTGGLVTLMVTGMSLSVTSMVGFLVLAGVVVNNGIVFVDYVNKLREEGYDKNEALIKTGRDRIRPIFMTALTTILAMSTMAMGVGMGAEMSQGVALVTIGGLSYSTLLTLFLIPALYDIIYRRKEMKFVNLEEELS